MKKIRIWAVLAVLLSVILGNGASNVFAETALSGAKKDAKILVAYFSRADENYNVGVIEKGTNVASEERKNNARPKLAGSIPNVSEYDIIFLGYPIWWGDLPMAVYTFLESGNFAGKIIIPFFTHEGSGDAGTVRRIQSACPKATVLKAFSMRGQTAQRSRDAAKRDTLKWLGEIKVN